MGILSPFLIILLRELDNKRKKNKKQEKTPSKMGRKQWKAKNVLRGKLLLVARVKYAALLRFSPSSRFVGKTIVVGRASNRGGRE